jgi:hypothetical protein
MPTKALALEALRPLEISPDSSYTKETLERKWRLEERGYWE